MSNPVINITVPVCHNGHHYRGLTVHDGVAFELVENCSGGQALQFSNTSLANPPTPNVGSISAATAEEVVCGEYLQLLPA
jgi:hypothetical protein